MLKRFFRYLRALFMGKLDVMEDPEVILNEALREMRENQIKNRERAVQALTQRNNLQNLVATEEKTCQNLEAKATMALQQGNRDAARQLMREKLQHDGTLTQLRTSLDQANQTCEAVKTAIQREEEQFRVKTAEALAMKANMKQAQIQIEINKALDGFQKDETSQSWDRAEERIRTMQSEAQARSEISGTSVNARLAQIQDAQVDVEAEDALNSLEVKMGLAKAPEAAKPTVQQPVTQAPPVVAPAPPESDVDKQLAELENKLNQTTN